MGFIVSRAFLEAVKAGNLRSYLSANSGIIEIFDFQNFPVFDGVGITTAMVLLSKRERPQQTRVIKVHSPIAPIDRTAVHLGTSKKLSRFGVPRKGLAFTPWRLSNSSTATIYARIDKAGQPLSRICKLGQGMQTGLNSVFGLTQAEVAGFGVKPDQVRHRARNTDIQRFHIVKRDEVLLYVEDVATFSSLPTGVKKYLQGCRQKLEARAAYKRGNCEWWQYTWPLQKDLYSGPRIVCPYLANENRFAIDTKFEFLGLTDTTVIFPTGHKENLKYICALLNSRLLNLRFKGIGKLKSGGILEYFDNSVSQLPIRRIDWKSSRDVDIHKKIVALFDTLSKSLSRLNGSPSAMVARDLRKLVVDDEIELNELVCELYGFTVDELATAEAAVA